MFTLQLLKVVCGRQFELNGVCGMHGEAVELTFFDFLNVACTMLGRENLRHSLMLVLTRPFVHS